MQALMEMSSLSGSNSKTFDYGQDGTGAQHGIWQVDRNYNPIKQLSPVSETARSTALAKAQLAALTQSTKPGYAFDPATKQTILTTGGEARANGYSAFRPVKEGDIRKDTQDTKVLNDVAVKVNNLTAASSALDQDQDQRNIIAQAITFADKDEQFRIGAFGTQLPTAFLNALGNSGVMRGATQQTRDYVVALLSVRESAMGMQRILTGSARSNESQIAALQATLPGLEPDSKLARQKVTAFAQNLDMLRQGLPKLPGVETVPVNRAGLGASSSTRIYQGHTYEQQADGTWSLKQ
jgi:hypothetical protein